MKPEEYTGSEWQYLLKQMDGKEIKKSLRSAIRAEAKKAQKIAQDKLAATDLQVQGNTADWKKGIRTYIYNPNRATGFMVTVKARAASRKTGKGEKSMHQNRKGFKKPVFGLAIIAQTLCTDGNTEARNAFAFPQSCGLLGGCNGLNGAVFRLAVVSCGVGGAMADSLATYIQQQITTINVTHNSYALIVNIKY